MTPWDAGCAAALLLARVTAGVLESQETTPVAQAVCEVIGTGRLSALAALWDRAHRVADDDLVIVRRVAGVGARRLREHGLDGGRPSLVSLAGAWFTSTLRLGHLALRAATRGPQAGGQERWPIARMEDGATALRR